MSRPRLPARQAAGNATHGQALTQAPEDLTCRMGCSEAGALYGNIYFLAVVF